MSRRYRVIQWATGRNGRALIRAVAGHPELELVGCKVFSADKHGRDAGEIAGLGPIGVTATTDRDEILALDADVVLHVPRLNPDRTAMDADLVDLLGSGKNVIELTGWTSYPPALGAGVSGPLEDACRRGGSTLYGSGLNPGFLLERLVPTVSGLCAELESITVTETYDCSTGSADMLFGAMGFGRAPGDWSDQSAFARMFTAMFTQALHVAAIGMGIELERVDATYSVSAADRDVALAAGVIPRGTVCRIDNEYTAVPRRSDDVRLVKRTIWTSETPDDGTAGIDSSSGWTIRLEGTPSLTLDLDYTHPDRRDDRNALYVGSAIGAIPEVCAAPPGFLLPTIFAPYRRHFGDVRGS